MRSHPDAPAAVRAMDRTLDALASACRLVTGVSLVALTGIFGWLVWGRYVLNATPTWVEQASLLLVMTIAFLGAAVGVHDGTHLSVVMLRQAAGRRLRAALVVLSDLAMLLFGGLMLWYGAQLTLFKWGSLIPLLGLPEGLRSLPLALGGGLIVLFTLGHLVRIGLGRDARPDGLAQN